MHTDAKQKKKQPKKTVKKAAASKKKQSKKTAVVKKKAPAKKTSSVKKAKTEETNSPATEETTATVSKDTTKPDVVVLYAAFKPTLRNAAKINFTAATPFTDTVKIPLNYVVPSQNLFFSYQPVPIKPLALSTDSGYAWVNKGYVKAGYGGYSTPYFETAWSFGDGRKNVSTLHAIHTSSKGNIPFQQFGKTAVDFTGIYSAKNNHEWATNINLSNNTQYLYGFQPSTLVFSKDDLRQQFNNVGAAIAYRRKAVNDYGITYSPSLGINYFFDAKDASELNVLAKVPVTKEFVKNLALKLDLTADVTSFKSNTNSISNSLFYLNTAVQYKAQNFILNAGIQPSWDNSETKLLPHVTAEAKINGEKFILEAGWVGSFKKNSYQTLAATNPWLQQPATLFNTQLNEQFAGFKGSAGNHLTYNARVSFLTMKKLPLFVNDNGDGKTFAMLCDSNIQAVKIHGEVGYSIQEKFSFLASANIYQFTKSDFDKPYGLIPFELTGTLKWKLLKDLHLKADVFMWDGAKYRTKSGGTEKLSAAVDLNAGVEYGIMPKLNLWLQFNNLLNTKYQRWNQYEVLGLNVIGGVVYSFR
jgi:hypothetical protein